MKITDIKLNDENPRFIYDERMDKLVASIKQFPKMMKLRPIIVDNEGVILGGNMRYRALLKLGYKELPNDWVKRAEDLTDAEKEEFIVKDNVQFGAWDMDALANQWDEAKLEEWGVDFPFVNPDELGDEFSLPDGDKAPFQQITFTLANEQAVVVKNALEDIKNSESFKYVETYKNENGNGNALYLLVSEYVKAVTE
jgi:hypothetical protein